MKICRKCGLEKPLTDFYRAAGTRDGLRGDCKACFQARAKARYPLVREERIAAAQKWRDDTPDRYRANQRRTRSSPEGKARQRAGHLKRKYGVTIEQYDELLVSQGGRCAICRREPRPDSSLHLDHDHESGQLRGILCFRCNNALGDFDDDASLLHAAVRYLESYQLAEVEDEVASIRERARRLRRPA
ncbi:MAG: hypothetical protein QOI99_2294 [Actinomycetota bacterium]|jgi:hypothetical protein|nr:hypothetical protein [Actinomycetota bacterium]